MVQRGMLRTGRQSRKVETEGERRAHRRTEQTNTSVGRRVTIGDTVTYHIATPISLREASKDQQEKNSQLLAKADGGTLGAKPKARADSISSETPWTDRLKRDMGFRGPASSSGDHSEVVPVAPSAEPNTWPRPSSDEELEAKAEKAMQAALAQGLS